MGSAKRFKTGEVQPMQDELDSFMAYAPLPIAILDERFRLVKMNQAMAQIGRVAPGSHLGKSLAEAIPILSAIVQPLLERVRATGEPAEALFSGGELSEGVGDDTHHWWASCFPSGESSIAFMAIKTSERVEAALQRNNLELVSARNDLEQIILVNEMSHCLQATMVSEELYRIVGRFGPRLFPRNSGRLCVIDASRNVIESTATWGETSDCEPIFSPNDCWALREGRVHLVDDPQSGLACPHSVGSGQDSQICVPMMAQSEMLGILHLQSRVRHPSGEAFTESELQLAQMMAREVALSLSNVGLREILRQQAFRDPMTGLYNRRFLQEALDLELRRAKRKRSAVSLIMLDVDGFKQFNDAHGHPAGDALLRAVATFLRSSVRSNDVLCRYGGDEFCIVMPETSLEDAINWVHKCRPLAGLLNVEWQEKIIPGLTVSMGIAAYPTCLTSEALFSAADSALYSAKASDRDQVPANVSSSLSSHWAKVRP